jgi:hypothetical protein
MRIGQFGRITAAVAMVAGIFGVVSVVAPLVWGEAGYLAIVTAVLTTVWVLLVGWHLVRLAAVPSG